jgi:hypothetical protein
MRWQRVCLIGFLMVAPTAAQAGSPGDAGVPFLRFGVGARAAGMGEAYAAVAEDASSVFFNPGAMPAVLGTHITLAHNEYFLSLRFEQAAITHETKWGTFGFMFTGLYMDDMDRYDDIESSMPLGQFGAYDVAAALAYGRYIVPNVAVGISVKTIYERIDELSATGFAFDAGIYHVSRIPGVKLAATVANLGPPMKYEVEEFALPRNARIGASYERDVASIDGRVLVTADALFPNDGDVRTHFGGEYSYRRMASLRLGYKAGYESQDLTFGFGVLYRDVAFDYAFLPVSNDLGDSHRFGLGFSF